MVETLLIGGGILIAFLLFIGWLVSTNDNEDTTTPTPPTGPDTEAEVIVPNNPFNTGIDYNNIDIILRGKAADGSSLQQFVVKAKDSSGNEHDQQITSVSGNQDQKNIQLSDIIGNATASSPLNIPLELIVVDDSPNNDVDHGQINIDDNTGGGGGGNGGDNNVDVDIDNAVQQVLQQLIAGNVGGGGAGGNGPIVIDNSQQQQQQQMAGGGVYGGINPQVYQMFMQQMQHMQMTQQQMMQQMMMFMQQNNYNQIDNEFMVQFMQQVMDIDIDIGDINVDGDGSGGGSGDVEIRIQNLVQNINLTFIENNVTNIVNQIDIDISQEIEVKISNIFINIINLINQEKYIINGDIIIIETEGGDKIEIEIEILMQFLIILAGVKKWELRILVQSIINDIDIRLSYTEIIQQLIVIYQESEQGDKDDEKLKGTKWEILERRIENSYLGPQKTEILLDIFLLRDPTKKYGFSPQRIAKLRNYASKIPQDDFPELADGILNYMEMNNTGNINEDTIVTFIDYIEKNWPVTTINKSTDSSLSNDNMGPSLEHNVQELIEKIEQEEQISKEVVQLDEDAIQKLKKALEYYEREKPLLKAMQKLDHPDHNNVSGQEFAKQVNEINNKLSDYDLYSESAIKEIRRDTHGMLENLQQAIKDLKKADQDLEKEIEIDSNLEKHISRLEDTVEQEMRESLDKLQTFQATHNG